MYQVYTDLIISTIVDVDTALGILSVYTDLIISTIVDVKGLPVTTNRVYTDLIISTIVDINIEKSYRKSIRT